MIPPSFWNSATFLLQKWADSNGTWSSLSKTNAIVLTSIPLLDERLLGLLCVMSRGITLSKNFNNGDTQLEANIFNYKIPRAYTRLCLYEMLRILHVRRYKMIQNTLHVSNTWHYVWGEGHNFFSFTLGRAIFLKMPLRAGPRFFLGHKYSVSIYLKS